jgi:YVTN family beta-propeller protein
MKQFKLQHLLIIIALASALASCHKDKINPESDKPTDTERAGLYVLDQGNLSTANSALTYYDYTSKNLVPDVFLSANSKGLGNTANDLKIYGSKMYIVVDVSGTVEVVNPKTAKSIKQVLFQNADKKSREPRSIAFYKGNAYISLYDNFVAVMDTATFTVSKYIPVGQNPEQLAVSNGKLYVANSGGLSYPDVDKTVSVIDLTTETVTKTLTVGLNPYAVNVDSYGDVFVNAYNVFPAKPTLTIIDSKADAVKSTTDFSGGPFSISGDNAYYIAADGTIKIYNVKTLTTSAANFITDGTTFTNAYAIAVDPLTNEVFVTDAKDFKSNGLIYAFGKNGRKEYSLVTGINPGSIVFVNK